MQKLDQNSLNHLQYIDGIRALAAIYVVFHHIVMHTGVQRDISTTFGALSSIFFFGNYAVAVFIVVSGFCLMLPVINAGGKIRHNLRTFYLRRARRILPPYYLSIIITLLLIVFFIGEKTGSAWDEGIPVTTKSLITHLSVVQDAFGESYSLNHPLWSISVEWRIYLFFPLLVILWRRIGPFKTIFLTIVFSHLLSLVWRNCTGYTIAASYVGLFTFGMLAASIASSQNHLRIRRFYWGPIVLILTFVVMVVAIGEVIPFGGIKIPIAFINYLVGVWAAGVIVYTSLEENWLHGILKYPHLVFVGTFSYSLYLIHFPLIQILWQYAFKPFQSDPFRMFLALSIVGIPVILGLSFLFFKCFEEPFLSNRARIAVRKIIKIS